MAQYFDHTFGLPILVPSKQDERETAFVSRFRTLVERTLTPQMLKSAMLPSKREVVVFVLQFFLTRKEYERRDVDNIGKTVLDSLKGKLYLDDVQVRTLLVSKKLHERVPDNFVFVGVKELRGETDIEVVREKLVEQGVTLYQASVKSSNALS